MLGSLFFVKLSLVTDKHFEDIIRFFASLRFAQYDRYMLLSGYGGEGQLTSF